MTSVWTRAGLAVLVAGLAQMSASAAIQVTQPVRPPVVLRPAPVAQTPIYLRDRITALGSEFNGRVGIAVRSVNDGWHTGWKADELYPQQSVSKLWVSIAALDAVDRGRVRLDDQVTLTRSDLTLFHQPIAAKILGGGYTTSLSDLMYKAITTSDNTCNDKLMRSIGGPAAVRAMIADKGLGAIRFYDGERALQSKIAGLIWSQSYSVGNAFSAARNALPYRCASRRSTATSRTRMTAPAPMRSSTPWRGSSAANCCRPRRPRACCRSWAIPRPARTGSRAGSSPAGR